MRRKAGRDPSEIGAVVELVRVIDELALALRAERGQGLGRASGMDICGVPLGRPGDEVVAGAADRPDVAGRRVLLEDHHVARDPTLGGGLPHD